MSTPTALVALLVPLATKDWLGPVATGFAALVAITGVIISTVIQRRTGRETVKQAQRSADAADRASKASDRSADASQVSATAADRSSRAAERSVEVNERIAGQAGDRAVADALAKRYQDAANQLGHEKAAVRLAGAYAMARLADDWPEQRPQCVDVLCAYLRMQPADSSAGAKRSEAEVRTSIVKLIGDHLLADHPANWCNCAIDLSGSEIDKLLWHTPTFNRTFSLSQATIRGAFWLKNATFNSEAHFIGTNFKVKCAMQSVRFMGDHTVFNVSNFDQGGSIALLPTRSNSSIDFTEAVVSGDLYVKALPSSRPQGTIVLANILVTEEGRLTIDGPGQASEDGKIYPDVDAGSFVRVADQGVAVLPPGFQVQAGSDSNGLGRTWRYRPSASASET